MTSPDVHIRKSSDCSGFTLMELMIVVSLLAMLTAMVTPVFSSAFHGIQAEDEMRNLVAYMEYAQNRSVTDATEYRVFLVPAMQIYWLEKAVMRDGAAVDYKVVEDRLVGEHRLPEKVELTVSRARRFEDKEAFTISFYPNGMSDDTLVMIKNIDDDVVFVVSTEGSQVRWMKGEV